MNSTTASCSGPSRRRNNGQAKAHQRGSLVIALVMLIAVLLLGISAAQMAMQGERMSRNERDRYVALEAAQAALDDAMLDIDGGIESKRSRSHIFLSTKNIGFPDAEEPICNGSAAGMFVGLCRAEHGIEAPAWVTVDFDGEDQAASYAVYGQFTGRNMQVGSGSLPSKPPRYIIELLVDRRPGQSAEHPRYFYRITAVGFGANKATQVALQRSFYKAGE